MKKQRKDTRVELVAELRKLPQSVNIAKIVEEAEAGEFHDFKNKKYACGKMAVVGFLEAAAKQENDAAVSNKLLELSQQVKDGEYDEEADEEDKAEMRKDLPKAMWEIFGL